MVEIGKGEERRRLLVLRWRVGLEWDKVYQHEQSWTNRKRELCVV